MTLYLDQQAGTLGFKTFLIDGNKTSTQDILFAKNQREFVEKVAAYASKLGVDCISTNSMIYANSTIE